MEHLFSIGQIVCLKADASRSGPILGVLPPVGGKPRYRVFHTQDQIAEYYEDQITAVNTAPKTSSWVETLYQGPYLDIEEFRARLTAARLSKPQVDNLYALQAARINFIPFQFKPILRFLRSDRPRLLIADEVGVGKTIEAGLILKELQTRQKLDNVLVVCPKSLVSKWRKEMRRFDEDFQILTSDILSYCLRETDLDGVWPQQYSKAIIHLELLRIEKYRLGTKGKRSKKGFQQLSPPPSFGLTIFDEAHHLRNTGTSSHEIAQFLCDISEAVIFLSATPLHLGNENLFTLLNLLRPDLFMDMEVFEEIVEPNQYINQAIRHVRHLADVEWQQKAAQALERASSTYWGRQVLSRDARFHNWHQKLQEKNSLLDLDRVRCIRDLEEVHTLAHVMNRTRRRDIGKFTTREPKTVSVDFTPEQKVFYQSLIEFRRQVLLLDYDPRVVRLITDTLERQASSCLPALLPTLDQFIKTGKFGSYHTEEISDDPDFDLYNEETLDFPEDLLEMARELRYQANSLPKDDPKLEQLLNVVHDSLAEEGSGKLLIFSFFIHTLIYLKKYLKDAGYRVAFVYGKVKDSERERLRERFRLPREEELAIDILLSSEVGCEGLDYEFCDRLVNYDIPWNPMRVEQRIGRIDRYGQKSDKVQIFNFITPGTVEERIFFRCFKRLGLFQDAIGDMEEVLGEIIHELNKLALDPNLSAEQAEAKTRQIADNKIRYIEEQRRLEEENSGLLGLDEVFSEDIETLINEGRFVSQNALFHMIERFVSIPAIGGQITTDPRNGIQRLRLNKEGRMALLDRASFLQKSDRTTYQFLRWLEGSDLNWLLTFDQKRALENRDVPFITPIHPLAKVAVKYWLEQQKPLVTRIKVITEVFPVGIYLFICELWESVGVRSEVRLITQVWDLDRDCLSHEVTSNLLLLIEEGSLVSDPCKFESHKLEGALHSLDEVIYTNYQEELLDLKTRNDSLVNTKLASLDTYYCRRLERLEKELSQAKDIRILRMKESEKSRIETDFERQRDELERRREADIIQQRVATGILFIERG